MKGIGGGFQIICISMNIVVNSLFTAKLHFSGCKIWVKYVIFWGSYLTNFPLAKSINICQLSLNTIEWLAKSRICENIWNFHGNRHFCEIHKTFLRNQKSAIIQKLSRILKFCKKKTDNFFIHFFPENYFFLHFSAYFIVFIYVHRMD